MLFLRKFCLSLLLFSWVGAEYQIILHAVWRVFDWRGAWKEDLISLLLGKNFAFTLRFVFGPINFGNGVEDPFSRDIMAFVPVYIFWYEIIETDGKRFLFRYPMEMSQLLSVFSFLFHDLL